MSDSDREQLMELLAATWRDRAEKTEAKVAAWEQTDFYHQIRKLKAERDRLRGALEKVSKHLETARHIDPGYLHVTVRGALEGGEP